MDDAEAVNSAKQCFACEAFDAEADNLEQVAEAVLLAIAEPLEWTEYDCVSATFSEDELKCYGVINEHDDDQDGFWEAHRGLHSPAEVSPFQYKTRDEARAACERHYATGEWD